MRYKILERDPYLAPYEDDIRLRMDKYRVTKSHLIGRDGSLLDFANGHEYFGFHRAPEGWYYREWAPSADAVYLMGDMNRWEKTSLPLMPLENGAWEILLPGQDSLWPGCKLKTIVEKKWAASGAHPALCPTRGAGPEHLCLVRRDNGRYPLPVEVRQLQALR